MPIQFNPAFFNMDADIEKVAELIRENDPNLKEKLRQAVYVAQTTFLQHLLTTLIWKNVSKAPAKQCMSQIYEDTEGLLVQNLKNLMAFPPKDIIKMSFESSGQLTKSSSPSLLQLNSCGHYQENFLKHFYRLILSELLKNDASAIFLAVQKEVIKKFSDSLRLDLHPSYHRQLMLSLLLPKSSTCLAALIRTIEYFTLYKNIHFLEGNDGPTLTYQVLDNFSPNLDIAKCGRADLVSEKDFSWDYIHSVTNKIGSVESLSLNQLCLMKDKKRLTYLLENDPPRGQRSFGSTFVFQAAYTGDPEIFHLALQIFGKISCYKELPFLEMPPNHLSWSDTQFSSSLIQLIVSCFDRSDCFVPLAQVLTDYTTRHQLSPFPKAPEQCFIFSDLSEQAHQFIQGFKPILRLHPLEVNQLFLTTKRALVKKISEELCFFESANEATIRSLSPLYSPLMIQFPQDADYTDLLAAKEILERSFDKKRLAENLVERFATRNPALLKTIVNILWGEEISLDQSSASTVLKTGISHFSSLLSLLFAWGFTNSADLDILSRCAELKPSDYLWIRILIIAIAKEKQIALIQHLPNEIIEKLWIDFSLSALGLHHLIQEQRYADVESIPLELNKQMLFLQKRYLDDAKNILFLCDGDYDFLPVLMGAMSFYLHHGQKENIEYIRQMVFSQSNEDYLLPLLFQRDPGYSFSLQHYAEIPQDQNLVLFLIKSIIHQSSPRNRNVDVASLFNLLLKMNGQEALDPSASNFHELAKFRLKNNPFVMQALHDIFSLSASVACQNKPKPIQNRVEILLQGAVRWNEAITHDRFDCILPASFYAKPKLPDFLQKFPYFITEGMFSDELVRKFKKESSRHFLNQAHRLLQYQSANNNQQPTILVNQERRSFPLEFLEVFEKIEMNEQKDLASYFHDYYSSSLGHGVDEKSINDFYSMENMIKESFFEILFKFDQDNYSLFGKITDNYYLQVLLIFLLRPTEQECFSMYMQLLKILSVDGPIFNEKYAQVENTIVFREPSNNDIRLFKRFSPIMDFLSGVGFVPYNIKLLLDEYWHMFFVVCVLKNTNLWEYFHKKDHFHHYIADRYIDFLKLVIASKSIQADKFIALTINHADIFQVKNEESSLLKFLPHHFFEDSAISFFIRGFLTYSFNRSLNNINTLFLNKILFIDREFRHFFNSHKKLVQNNAPQTSYPFQNRNRCLAKIAVIIPVLSSIESSSPNFLSSSLQDKFAAMIQLAKKIRLHLLPVVNNEKIPVNLDFFWKTYCLLQEILSDHQSFFEFSRSIFKYIFRHDQYATTLDMLKLSIEQNKKDYIDQLIGENPRLLEATIPHTQLSAKDYLACQGTFPELFPLEFSELGLSICFLRELNGRLLTQEIGLLTEFEEILAKIISVANHVGVHTTRYYEQIIGSDNPCLLPPSAVSGEIPIRTTVGVENNNFFSVGIQVSDKIKPDETPLNRDRRTGLFYLDLEMAQKTIPETMFSSLHLAALDTRRAEPIMYIGNTMIMIIHETSALSVETPTRRLRFISREDGVVLSEKNETVENTIFDATIQTSIQKLIQYIRALSPQDHQKILEFLMQLNNMPGNEALLSIFYNMYNLLFHPLNYELKVQKSLSIKDENLISHRPTNLPNPGDIIFKTDLLEILKTPQGPVWDALLHRFICNGDFDGARVVLAHGYDVRRSPRALWTAMALGLVEYYLSDDSNAAYTRLNKMMQLLMFPSDYLMMNYGFPIGIGLNPDLLTGGEFWSYGHYEGFSAHLQIAYILPEKIFIQMLPLMLKNAPNLYIHFTLSRDQEKIRLIEQYFYQGQKVPENTRRMLAIFQNIAEDFEKGIFILPSFLDKCGVNDFLPFYTGLIELLCKNQLEKAAIYLIYMIISFLEASNNQKQLLPDFKAAVLRMLYQYSIDAGFTLSYLDEKSPLILSQILLKKEFSAVEVALINDYSNKIVEVFLNYPVLLESLVLKFFYQYFILCSKSSLEPFNKLHGELFDVILEKNQKIKFSLLFIHCLAMENSSLFLDDQLEIQFYALEHVVTYVNLSDYVSFMHSCDNIKYSNAFLYIVNFFSDFGVFLEFQMVSQLETLPENSCFLGINETSFTLWSEFLDKLSKNNPDYFNQMGLILSHELFEGKRNNIALFNIYNRFYGSATGLLGFGLDLDLDPDLGSDLAPDLGSDLAPDLGSDLALGSGLALTALGSQSIFKRPGDSLSGPAHKPFAPAASSSSQ